MANASLTVSLPFVMRDFIEAQLREGTFSTPSEYIRSLIRLDQQQASRRAPEAFVRGRFHGRDLPRLDNGDRRAKQAFVVERTTARKKHGRRDQGPARLKGRDESGQQ
jgi:Arc/MetJ-type ribon-helix-helix transcriptional regulator